MILNIIVGETGSGKSHTVKEIIKKYPLVCVLDIQNEYSNLPFYEESNDKKRFRVKDSKFFYSLMQKLKGYCFVNEEATSMFEGRIGTELQEVVISKRHTQNRYVFVFHGLHYVPPKLMLFCDYLTILKTQDLDKNIKSKYPEIFPIWKEVQKMPKYSRRILRMSNLAKDNKY